MPRPARFHAALPASAPAGTLVQHIAAALDAVDARLRTAHDALSEAQRDTPRADGGWSLNTVLEHMVLTNESYLEQMRALVQRLRAGRATQTTARWHATFVGKWLARSLEMRIPLPAPRRVQPGPRARPQVLHAVIASHHEMVSLMTSAIKADWTVERMVSPLNTIVRMNLGDAGVIVLRHSERHAAQIERLVAQLVSRGEAT